MPEESDVLLDRVILSLNQMQEIQQRLVAIAETLGELAQAIGRRAIADAEADRSRGL